MEWVGVGCFCRTRQGICGEASENEGAVFGQITNAHWVRVRVGLAGDFRFALECVLVACGVFVSREITTLWHCASKPV